MPHFNSMTVIGHLGKDPELRYTQGGTAVVGTSVAVQWGWGDNKDSEWFKVTVWGKTGEKFSEWCRKGDAVLLQGEYRLDKWEDKKTGEVRSKPAINVNSWTKVSTTKKEKKEEGPDGEPEGAAEPAGINKSGFKHKNPQTQGRYMPEDPADDGIPF